MNPPGNQPRWPQWRLTPHSFGVAFSQ